MRLICGVCKPRLGQSPSTLRTFRPHASDACANGGTSSASAWRGSRVAGSTPTYRQTNPTRVIVATSAVNQSHVKNGDRGGWSP